jgi:hypothetical protein
MLCQVKSVKPMKNLSQGRGRRFCCGRSISEKAQMSDVTSAEVVSFWRETGPERWFVENEESPSSAVSITQSTREPLPTS